MRRTNNCTTIFPPDPPIRIKYPVIDQDFAQCSFRCMSGDPQCGCWNDYGMMLHYNQEKFHDHKEGNFPPY